MVKVEYLKCNVVWEGVMSVERVSYFMVFFFLFIVFVMRK